VVKLPKVVRRKVVVVVVQEGCRKEEKEGGSLARVVGSSQTRIGGLLSLTR